MALKMKSFIYLPVSLFFPFLIIPFIWKSGALTLKAHGFLFSVPFHTRQGGPSLSCLAELLAFI
jgi:hypothetical protein